MKRIHSALAASLIATLCAITAHATPPGNNGGGNGPCGVGQQTNGCGTAGNTTNSPTANAGAIAGAAAQSNAAAIAAQQQRQQQGQSQSSRNSNRNSATATGGAATTGAVSTGSQSISVEGARGDVFYAPAQDRAPVSTAYASPLAASSETCMGSSSGGAQGANFGVTFGTTWESAKCDRRMNARTLQSLGLTKAAIALMCQDDDIAKAMEASGGACPASAEKRAGGPVPARGEASAQQYQDPIIRKRLGLPPL